MDMVTNDPGSLNPTAILRHGLADQVTAIFLADQNDIASRLWAVRAGGKAYFTHPLDVGKLIDKLDALLARDATEPYRILIIEDDQDVASYYTLILQSASMQVVAITDPLKVMQPLIEFNPDLILMDVYMPGCTGPEMAAVIRQQESYDGIPIVFLSAETRLHQQLDAMHQGGDDFLTKPIQPDHLISAISSRAQRSRVAQRKMIRDGLTGLLNHTRIKEQLNREIEMARRRETTVSLALIDLDHFKSVNDVYGHSVGDRVLKSLSRVLQQRLRRTDVIGRYGGEEFAIIMSDTSGYQARVVLDEIRNGFAHIRQHAENSDFSVTFSCGIASFPLYNTAALLNRAADQALYLAKRRGRNQIVLAD
jgi:diguanylate cyclase (GGDEF)-like protein